MESSPVSTRPTPVHTAAERPVCTRRFGVLTLPVSQDLTAPAVELLAANGLCAEEVDALLRETGEYAPSYREYLNSAGIEAEPLLFHDADEALLEAMDRLDGILLTGGDTIFDLEKFTRDGLEHFRVVPNPDKPYLLKARRILEKAKAINAGGRFFPLFAICLGFEAVLLSESDFQFPIAHVRQNDVNVPVALSTEESRFRAVFSEDEKEELGGQDLVYFYHNLGFLPQDFAEFAPLRENYLISGFNETPDFGTEIAVVEHREMPIFGVQFHPEKSVFDDSAAYAVNRSERARALNAKFIEAVAGEERRGHKEVDSHEEMLRQAGLHSVTLRNLGGAEHMTFVSRNPALRLLAPQTTSIADC